MLAATVRRVLPITAALALSACPPTGQPVDSGVEDAGVIVTPCSAPQDCREAGLSAACRQGECAPDVPCGNDLECGLGERCVSGQCRFTGCTADEQCATGKCLTDTFSCVECGQDSDCPAERPVCDTRANVCVSCRADSDCPRPGPAHCDATGACVHCTENAHCPTGLVCANTVCVGAGESQPCPEGIACAPGLACVLVGTNPMCLRSCNLYSPECPVMGHICYRLTYSNSNSLVFEADGPIGVCFAAQPGLRGLKEPCTRSMGSSNCQPNLQCVPESAQLSLCRAYCNPSASGACPPGELCRAFPGDYAGRPYGLCLPNNGFGEACTKDAQCRTGLSCQAYDDPSAASDVGPFCQFNVGTRPGLSPCGDTALPDGGVTPADRTCQSGACVADPLFSSFNAPGYFCFAACKTNADCGADGGAGVCDADFDVTTPFETVGRLRGCRPSCHTEADCAGYDAGVTCRIRVVTSLSAPAYASTCSPPGAGNLPAGAACTSGLQCRSAYCFLDDARGVRRSGTCVEPCRAGQVCSPDGGAVLPLDCQPTALLLTRGYDGRAGTTDDGLATPTLCSGARCAVDADCGAGVCAVDVDPSMPGSGFVRRCRMPTAGTRRGGEACTSDLECRSGVCGVLQPPSTGTGRACYEACDGASACPGTTTCRAGALRVDGATGSASFDSCAP